MPFACNPRVRKSVQSGVRLGGKSAWYLIRLIVPISLAANFLQWSGYLTVISQPLAPAMRALGLPGEASIALVSGWLAGVYGGLAAMTAVPFTVKQLNIFAVMMLVGHNFLVESTVQDRTGMRWWKITGLRLAVSFLLAALLNVLLPAEGHAKLLFGAVHDHLELGPMLWAWALRAARLIAMIAAIVLSLTVTMQLLREFGWFNRLAAALNPLMKVFGLTKNVSFLWVTANLLGLAYGAGLIMNESRSGAYTAEELRDLNSSIGISHSLLEGTIIFLGLGANLVILVVPRLVAAIVVVHLLHLFVRQVTLAEG